MAFVKGFFYGERVASSLQTTRLGLGRDTNISEEDLLLPQKTGEEIKTGETKGD